MQATSNYCGQSVLSPEQASRIKHMIADETHSRTVATMKQIHEAWTAGGDES